MTRKYFNLYRSLLSTALFASALFSYTTNADVVSFRDAKKALKSVYADHQITFYCGCSYNQQRKPGSNNKTRLSPDWRSCGYKPRKQAKRAARIEWEHVMPAHHFGQQMQCWRNGGRKACKKDPVFRAIEGDMHNLVPAIGEVNGDRSNYKFGIIEGEERVYGLCDSEVDFKARRFEPPANVRGDIARIYFYMSDKYKIRLSAQQRKLFNAWNKLDPVDDFERVKNARVYKIQGNRNNFVN